MKELCKKLKKIKGMDTAIIEKLEKKSNEWEMEKARSTSSNKMQIACVGIYNAGKSTLLNALIGKKVFTTGDVPTTDSVDKYDNGELVYIDTPGLNANDLDNATAAKGYKESDIILFVSNIQNGGLNKAEAKYLEELKMALGSKKMLQDNVVFVLSNKHRMEADKVEKVVEQHKKNIEDVFGIEVSNIYVCDAVTYVSGVTQNQDFLIEASGILEVKERINELLTLKTKALREERADAKKLELEKILVDLNNELKQRVTSFAQASNAVTHQLNELENIKTNMKESLAELKTRLSVSEQVPRECFIHFDRIPSISNKKSKYDVTSYIRSKVENRYNKRESIVRNAVNELSEFYLGYLEYEQSSDNYFYNRNSAATQLVLEYANQLKRYEIKVPADILHEIQFIPEGTTEIISNMKRDLADDVVEYGQYYSVDYYAGLIDIEEYEDYSRKGLFGGTKYTYSAFNTYEALEEMEKDLRQNLNRNIGYLWRKIKQVIVKYNEKVEKELEIRMIKLDQLVESHKQVVKSSMRQADQVAIKEVVQLLDKTLEEIKQA